jgi:hypothetical protein
MLTISVRNHRLVNFCVCTFRLDGVQRGHEDIYWLERNVSMSSGELFMLLAPGSIVEVTNNRGRDELPSLW